MKITEQTVDRIADLSKLRFEKSEKAALIDRLRGVVGFVDTLHSVDTSSAKPASYCEHLSSALREDTVAETLPRECLLDGAPKTDGEYFIVPKTVVGED